MAISAEDDIMSSLPDIDEVSSMLQKQSRFFTEIWSVTESLTKLNYFLVGSDPKSAEKLLSKFVENLLDRSRDQEPHEYAEEDCLVKLSQVLQERRVVDFLCRAGSRVRDHISHSRELCNRKLVYSYVDEYFDSSTGKLLAWLTEKPPVHSVRLLPDSTSIGFVSKLLYRKMAGGDLDSRYWIDVSGLYKIEKLLEIMGQQLSPALHRMSGMTLIDKLMPHSVQRNRFMFVLDDVFHEEFSNFLKNYFGEDDNSHSIAKATPGNGTFTYIKEGSIAKATPGNVKFTYFKEGLIDQVRKLGPLSEAESWELFCRIAFRDEPEQRCPAELELLSEEIVEMCKGFPIPIVAIADLLSKRERKEFVWESVRNGFNVHVKTNLHLPRVLDNLSGSSFYDLPYRLRLCFFYFGLFPPHSVIPIDKLYKLWIAEGFVEENGEKTLEEVAEEYLSELIDRNFVRSYHGLNRFEKYCQVDRLILDTAQLNLNRSNSFSIVLREYDFILIPTSRHLSICSDEDVDPGNFDSELHSLFLFGGDRDATFMIELIQQCPALKVLDFEYYPIERVTERVGDLIQLKYLSLKNTKVKKLPKSVDKLVNLQTLDVRNTLLEELPAEINMLKNLRHLLASVCDDGISQDPSRGVRLKKGIGKLQNLQTLMTMEAQDNNISVIKEMAALDQLRTLGVSGLTAKTVKALWTCVGKLGRLKSLTLQAMNGDKVLQLPSISSELPLLQRLVLKGMFQNLPDWIFRLRNLSVLCLTLAPLTDDQFRLLSHLPNLVSLWLCRVYKRNRLYFKSGSFEKLKLLVLREFHGLHELEIEDGALPCLEEFRIGSSPFLIEAPSGIQYLKNLKILINYDMHKEFVVSMQPSGGLDYWKVKHIPYVFFLYRVQGR